MQTSIFTPDPRELHRLLNDRMRAGSPRSIPTSLDVHVMKAQCVLELARDAGLSEPELAQVERELMTQINDFAEQLRQSEISSRVGHLRGIVDDDILARVYQTKGDAESLAVSMQLCREMSAFRKAMGLNKD